ncbi:MAG TPA: hypothetical protein VF172_01755 [Nitrososphaera sp.]|jgi:hypothetical protein
MTKKYDLPYKGDLGFTKLKLLFKELGKKIDEYDIGKQYGFRQTQVASESGAKGKIVVTLAGRAAKTGLSKDQLSDLQLIVNKYVG